VEELAKYAGVPVWNGLTNEFHPTQILADFLTISEHFGHLKGVKLVYMGDARYNMGNSLMVGCAKMGMHFVACAPRKYFPDPALIDTCRQIAKETGAVLEFIEEPMAAVKDADVIYTDVWASMGQEGEAAERRKAFEGVYQVNDEVMAAANKGCMVMHCLPAHRGEEITDSVFEAHANEIFDEAENRLHAQKAVLVKLMKG